MSAQATLLREAARLMRQRAEAANTDEARRPYGNPAFPPVPRAEWGGLVDNYLGGEIGIHCASWHPLVALAVADWLDQEADRLEVHIPAWTRPSSGVDDPPGMCCNNPQCLAEVVEHHYGRALAVARAYVGGVA